MALEGQPDVDYLTEQGTGWRCDPCNKTRRKSMRLEYAAEGLTLETIMNTLKEMREEQKTNTADFNRSYEMLYSKVEENTVTLRDAMGKIEDYLREIEQLKSENGIPEEKEEQVSELVKKVGKALDVNITDSMIDACHRIGKKTSERNQARGIVVKFVRRTDKEELMKKRREKKRDFSTRHLGLTMDIPVYLNESLSPARRRLLAQARQLRKERGYKYIWLRNGNILLRKEEKAPVVEIRTQADLNGL
ncbi:uncharacterized protein LOC124365334 [Homalodisca vitripennis]|uniref:uncharacterized protein LOC124365334 n=1 Tax=Homalodisca vitripennis TaxID=197043 RepID=UPI001EEBF9D3|nr:uncharacterized protein LOC124365334 [Homalodisca vitripennis]